MKVNIFTPIYHRYIKTKISIESIIESIELSEHDVTLHIGINGIENEEMSQWLEEVKKHPNVMMFASKKNIGKAHIINLMHEHVSSADYFISVDSDMVAHENEKYIWIDEMVKLFEHGPASNFGLLSTWQDEYNAHNLDIIKERTEFLGHEIWFGAFWGVAGGCVMLKDGVFRGMGRYQVHDVYSGDDALLMRNVDAIGKLVGITNTIKLKHQANLPEEKEYQQWKVDKCRGNIPVGANTKGFWD